MQSVEILHVLALCLEQPRWFEQLRCAEQQSDPAVSLLADGLKQFHCSPLDVVSEWQALGTTTQVLQSCK